MATSQLFLNSVVQEETGETRNPYYDYFTQPHGGGIGTIYGQSPYFQKGYGYLGGQQFKSGRGIGDALASIWRFAFPLIKKGAQALGLAAADVASNVASDVIEGKNFKESALEHVKSKGAELIKEIPSNIKEIIQGDTPQTPAPTPALAAPTPTRFRRIGKKRKVAGNKNKFPALKHFK